MAEVLLIDDDSGQLEVRALILVHHGHQVTSAASPEEAKDAFHRQTPDAIVMDLRLPAAEDGRDLIRWLRHGQSYAGTIVVLSGFPGDLAGRPEAGLVNKILTKPVRSEILLTLLTESGGSPRR